MVAAHGDGAVGRNNRRPRRARDDVNEVAGVTEVPGEVREIPFAAAPHFRPVVGMDEGDTQLVDGAGTSRASLPSRLDAGTV